MKRKICSKKFLTDRHIELVEDKETGKYHVIQDGKELHKYKLPVYHKHGKTITYYSYLLYEGKVPTDSAKGYTYKQVNLLEHVLVWLWFNGDIPEGMDIDHIDNDPLNNHISNLQLLTRTENLRKRGIGHNQYSYDKTDAEILAIREARKEKLSARKHREVK